MSDLEKFGIIVGIILGIMSIIGLIYLFVTWILNFKKKPNFDTEKRFSAEDVNALTEQAREDEKKRIKENLINFGADLEKSGNHAGAKKLAEAQEALANNELSKADKLFAEIEDGEELALLQFADISFARGYIAEEEIRWKDATQHYIRAAELDPSFDTLVRAQSLSQDIGDYHSALSFGLKAQKAAIAEYGKGSIEHAIALNNLGGVYQKQKQYKKAEDIFKQSLKIREKIFGEIHPITAITINNLATIYYSQKDDKKACEFFEKALEINKELSGENHPYTATSLNNLGGAYRELGELTKAKSLIKRALNIRKDILGDNHPDIANSYNNLGGVYSRQRQHKKAEPYCRQALEIYEATFGLNHPITIQVKTNYELLKKHLAKIEKPPPNNTGGLILNH